jgi:hypothetical protein
MIKTKWAFEIKWPEQKKAAWDDDDKEKFIHLYRFAPLFELRSAYPRVTRKTLDSRARRLGLKREYKPEHIK